MVQFHWISSWTNTDYNNSDTRCSDLVGDVSWVFSVGIGSLRSVSEQHQNLAHTSSSTVGFVKQFPLCQSKSSIDTRDGSHQWDGINGIIEGILIEVIIQSDAEFSIERERDDACT